LRGREMRRMHVRKRVTSVKVRPLRSRLRRNLAAFAAFRISQSYPSSHTTNMSDPPYALFVLVKSITNEVSTAGSVKHVPDTNNRSISIRPLSAPTMATATRAGISGSQPILTTTCPHAPKFTSHLQTPSELSHPYHPPSSRRGSARRPKTAQSGCRRCRAPKIRMRRSISSTRP
jgi:hypothetical protein